MHGKTLCNSRLRHIYALGEINITIAYCLAPIADVIALPFHFLFILYIQLNVGEVSCFNPIFFRIEKPVERKQLSSALFLRLILLELIRFDRRLKKKEIQMLTACY